MDKLSAVSCEEFVSSLASRAPVPGGGGAAALAGALGASLCAMAGNLTVGKKKFADVEEDIKRIVSEAEALSVRFTELIDEDAAAFEPLSKAYSMPKDAPDYEAVMTEVTLNACRAPAEIMECCCRAVELLERLYPICSRLMVSDVGCGAVLAKAALEAAAMNVFVNTRTLRRSDEAKRMEQLASSELVNYGERADRLIAAVTSYLRGD